jgi:hypothetical protein
LEKFEDQDKKYFVTQFIVPEGLKVLQEIIKVKSTGVIPKFNSNASACSNKNYLDIDPSYSSKSTYADFILFLGVKNLPDKGWLAYASFCALEQEQGRPVAGFIVFNEAKVSFEDGDYNAQVDTFMHEVLHTLFFHSFLFKSFPDNNNGESFLFQDSDTIWKMRGDTVLGLARQFFGCPSLNGVPLENNGDSTSAGSHFEKIVFADEIMTPDDTLETRLSMFTLAVAKDSGFYEIDISMGENIFWGKGEGCDFVNAKCSPETNDEFCSIYKEVSCSDNLMFRTLCQNSQFTSNCKINLHVENCKVHRKEKNIFSNHGRDSLCLKTKVFFFVTIVHKSCRREFFRLF